MGLSWTVPAFLTPYRQATVTEKGVRTDVYQMQMLHKEFAQPLNGL